MKHVMCVQQCVLTYITVLLLLSLQDLLSKLTLPSAVPTFILRGSIERSIHFQHACGRTACVLTPVPLSVDLLLQDLLSKLALPGAVLTSIQKSFAPGSLLIARSSANVEDLAGTSLQRPHLSTGQHVTHITCWTAANTHCSTAQTAGLEPCATQEPVSQGDCFDLDKMHMF